MKAVILAGGKGDRLIPLTCHLPKPMAPILNKPVMEYIIELLREHGFSDIYVTLHYLGHMIKDYFGDGNSFGVNITYIEEKHPLGTAGGIKLAENFLDETFLVISGDAITDINLSEALAFHQKHKKLCTVIAKSVEIPLEYGLIIGDPKTKEIQGFIEKPRWNEVCTNLVNTGIYLFEPEVLQYIKMNVSFDFSRDLFPFLLDKGKSLFYFETNGYWLDIGSLHQYRQAQFDLLERKVKLPLNAREIKKGVWVEDEVYISDETVCEGPIYIGKKSWISEKCNIKPYSVIGSGSYIQKGCYVESSVLWSNQTIMENCRIYGATIAKDCVFQNNATIHNGAIIGEKVHVKNGAVVGENVFIWPTKQIPSYFHALEHVKWGELKGGDLFKERGITGISHIQFTPEFVVKLGLAFGSTIPQHSLILLGSDGTPYSKAVLQIINQSLLTTGVQTMQCSEPLATPMFQYACQKDRVSYGIFVQSDKSGFNLVIEFYDGNGIPINSMHEYSIQKSLKYSNFRRVPADRIGCEWNERLVLDSYFKALLNKIKISESHSNYHFVIMNQTPVQEYFFKILSSLPCSFTVIHNKKSTKEFSEFIQKHDLDGGFILDRFGENLKIFDQHGQLLNRSYMDGLYLYLSIQSNHQEKVYISPNRERKTALKQLGTPFSLQYDAFFLFLSIIQFYVQKNEEISSFQKSVKKEHVMYEQVECQWKKRGSIMRKLLEEFHGTVIPLQNGIKICHHDECWTMILPHLEKPIITILTKAKTHHEAKETTTFYLEKIAHYQKS